MTVLVSKFREDLVLLILPVAVLIENVYLLSGDLGLQ